MVQKIELMAIIGMERMWKNIYPWTDGKLKLIGKFGMERMWKIFISGKYGEYAREYLN